MSFGHFALVYWSKPTKRCCTFQRDFFLGFCFCFCLLLLLFYHGGDNDLLTDFIVYYFQNNDTTSRPSRDHSSHEPVVESDNPLQCITTIQDHRQSGCINPAFTGQVNGSPPTKHDDDSNYQPLLYEEVQNVELPTVPPPSYEEATKAV